MSTRYYYVVVNHGNAINTMVSEVEIGFFEGVSFDLIKQWQDHSEKQMGSKGIVVNYKRIKYKPTQGDEK